MQKPDQNKLNSFLDRMIGDLGAMATGPLVVLGDRLGLFKAMRDGEKLTASELAERTSTHERYVREWLAAQAAAGYVSFEDTDEARFYLDPEQAAVFADDDSPAFMVGAFEVRAASWIDEPKVAEVFLAAKASLGMTTRSVYSAAPSASSARAITRTSSHHGYRRWRVW